MGGQADTCYIITKVDNNKFLLIEMVFFTCNTCNESLKKNQVEKHYTTKCRRCEVLTSVDCMKDFPGDSYKDHTTCMTEAEKYNGKDYVPKPGANKGQVKQDAWTEQVQAAIAAAKADKGLKDVLQQVSNYDNVPRKKGKFENFLKNSLRIRDASLVTRAWELISAGAKPSTGDAEAAGSSQSAAESHEYDQTNGVENAHNIANGHAKVGGDDKKLSKRERKEERSKKKDKSKKGSEETKDVDSIEPAEGKKKRQRKHEEDAQPHDAEAAA